MTVEELVKWLRNEHRKYVAGTTVTTTGYSQAADRIEALTAEVEWKEAALRDLVKEYVSNVDPYRTGRFYIDPEQEDVVVEARAALEKQP